MNIIGIVVACENEIITILKSKFKLVSMLDEKPYKTFLYEIENKKVYVSLSGIGETSSSAWEGVLVDLIPTDEEGVKLGYAATSRLIFAMEEIAGAVGSRFVDDHRHGAQQKSGAG